MAPRAFIHHADHVQEAVSSGAAARSALVASWRRSSKLHHLDPARHDRPRRLSDAELARARERMGPLIAAAQASLDRLFLAVGGIGCCVLLADHDGVPVDRRGASADDRTFEDWGLWTGAIWSEESEGTNGIGTCLIEKRTLTIHRDQHFFTRNTLLSCTTAPIFDHEGELAGALDVSSCRADLTGGLVDLITVAVSDAARRIEAENFRQSFPKARILIPSTSEQVAGALVAVDNDDFVIGATHSARLALGLTPERLSRPLPVSELLDLPEGPAALAEAERGVLHRALLRAGGNVTHAARLLGVSRATLHRKLKRLGIERFH